MQLDAGLSLTLHAGATTSTAGGATGGGTTVREATTLVVRVWMRSTGALDGTVAC